MRRHYSDLYGATKSCLQHIAAKLYSKELISLEVKDSLVFDKIHDQFVAIIHLYKEDMTKLEELCFTFIQCLASAGGSAKVAAIALSEDWERNLNMSFKIETSSELALVPEITIGSKDKIPLKMQELHKKFLSLLLEIRIYYDECNLYKLKNVARWLSQYFEVPLSDSESFDQLFDSILCHYDFLNSEPIEELAEQFPLDDKLQSELDQYAKELQEFERSTELQDMKTAIKQVPLPYSNISEDTSKITIKLTGTWRKNSVKNLRKLMVHLFGKDSKRFKLIDIDEGSVTVIFLVPSSSAQSLIDKANVQFMSHLGIFQLIISSQTIGIVNEAEIFEFAFQDSLLYVIKRIDSNAEYERIALLLMEFKIDLNYQNTEGQTALELASEGGHAEIFRLLLLNGADPFIQRKNERFIGLNNLACTTLYRNIYRSDDIRDNCTLSVRDMLKKAIKEEGMGIYLYMYSPVVFLVEKKLRERFQLLHSCFQVLDNKFVDMSNEVLANTALVTEAKSNYFCSYIEEGAKCNNAHQLLNLLQPHYSCLNINLLNIECLIMEPIKEMVDHYNTKLKTFKDTTTLLEFVMLTSTKEMEANIGDKCSKLILKLNKPWGSKTITELNKMEACFFLPISSFLNLIEMHQDGSSFTCTYLIPASQFQPVLDIVIEKRNLLHKIGVYEIFVNSIPVLMEDEDESFKFEDALQKAYQDNDEDVLFFLIELNVSLSSASDIVPSVNNINSTLNNIENSEIVQTLLNEHNDGQTALITACLYGHHQVVELLLSKDSDINFQDNDGRTALMLASRYGHHQVVELLLSKDPDINIQDNDGATALMFASQNGHHKVVELLLSKDPDINIQSKNGVTALMLASQNGHHKVVELLLSKDPDINIQSNNVTALMLASQNGHHKVVELLLSKDINIQSNNGVTALMLASQNGHHQIVELLLSKDPDINIQNNKGVTTLMVASANGHHQFVELLLSKDPDINIQDNDGWTALMVASQNGHHKIVELLLSKDPDINIQSNNRVTALMLASQNGDHQIVKKLLSKDPDINIQSNKGVTALMLASADGHHQVVELLLSKDPDINIQDNDGWTALMVASQNGHHQVVELLLSKDPDINIQSNNGVTALVLASQNGHHQIVELLLSKDPDINIQNNKGVTTLMVASANGHHQFVELLLSKDPDINIQDNDGWTALMVASANGHHKVVELLLSKDPDINIQDNDGWTVLISASCYGHHQVVELLLSKDPDINIRKNDGWTALMVASQNGHHQVVELLLSKDPDINIQSNNGWTALMVASANGHHKVVELLLSKDPDINIQSNDGVTALTFASGNGYHQVVELLLSKDPDINIQNNNGWTALMVASANGHHKVVELLLSKDPDINIQDNDGWTVLISASCYGHHQIVELLLSKDPDINIRKNDGLTALTIASADGHHQVVELLLSKDPDINIQSNDGWTALMLASQNGHHQVVELLLNKDPDINIQSNNGVTALMLASHYGHHQVVELLLSKDPDIKKNIQSRKCAFSMEDIISAFTIACCECHSSIMILLSKKLATLSSDERKLLVAAAEGDIGTLVSMLFEVGMSPDTPLVGGITPLMIAASCGHIEMVDTLIQAGADVNKTNDGGKTALDILLGKKEEGTASTHIIDLLITNGASPPAQANPTQSLFKEIFSPLSNISLIRSMTETSTETVERPAQINEPAQKVEELSENELAQYTQQH